MISELYWAAWVGIPAFLFNGGWIAAVLIFIGYWNLRSRANRYWYAHVLKEGGIVWGMLAFIIVPFQQAWVWWTRPVY